MAQKISQPIQSFDPEIALMDQGQLAGSFRTVADKTARNAIFANKRAIGSIVSWTDTGTIYRMAYVGPDLTDTEWQKDTNWINVAVYNEAETVNRTIYVATTGNDTTGDGSVGLPYLTIGKALSTVKKVINSGITVTISIGVGTFTMSAADLSVLSSISGSGTLTIQGTLTLVESGFTMGAAVVGDPLTFNVSGGNTATWTLNQWRSYFLKVSTQYYPITHNALTPTLSTVIASTGNEIYQAQTIINLNGIRSFNINTLTLSQLTIDMAATSLQMVSNAGNLTLNRVYVASSSTSISFQIKTNTAVIGYVTFVNSRLIINQPTRISLGSGLIYSYLYANDNIPLINFQDGTCDVPNTGYGLVFENPNTGAAACGLQNSNSIINNGLSGLAYLKFVNCNVGIFTGRSGKLEFTIQFIGLIIVNTNFLFKKATSNISDYQTIKVEFINTVITGTPNTRWFSDNMYEFVNLVSGRNIQLGGIIFPEVEQNLSATLTNNTTTNIIVGNKLQNRTIHIDYMILRGTGYRKGSFDIINDGTALYMSPDTFITNAAAGVNAVAIVLSANYNTNEIRVAALLDNGVAGTFTYNATRVMITPLTI